MTPGWVRVQNAVLGLLDLPDPLRVWLQAELVTESSRQGAPDPQPAAAAHRLLAATRAAIPKWAAERMPGLKQKRELLAVLAAVVPTAMYVGRGLNDVERADVAKAVEACG